MAEGIVNRVAQSKLITFNLEDYYLKGNRVQLDIKDWLFEGLIVKEKEFRNYIAQHNWEQYKDTFVALHCSSEAIVPGWAYMLVSTHLQDIAKKVILGNIETLEALIYQEELQNIDFSEFQDRPVIVKGCSKKPVPSNAYLFAIHHLQKVASSIMYGEACSSVPLFKRK